ncbi:MAG: cation-translocating P-type ATPase [Desulfomonilia bacterium]
MENTEKADTRFYAEDAEAVLKILDSSPTGITDRQVRQRIETFGANVLPKGTKKHPVLKFLGHFNNVLIYVLLLASAVTALLGQWIDMSIILAVVLVNGSIGFVQERKAEKSLEAVRSMLSFSARVLRDDQEQTIEARHLVPGDIVFLASGEKVPADIRLLSVKNLQVNEASLTGESEAVEKTTDPVEPGSPLGDRSSMAYSGTLIVSGRGKGVVTATGKTSEIGRISSMLSEIEEYTTPLLRQIGRFGTYLSVVILVIAALTFTIGYFSTDIGMADIFLAVVGIAVAAIPEGLPAIITITLAVGVQRMSKRNAIIRRLPAVETLGSVTVICSDKTGTMTRGEMVATRIVMKGEEIQVTGTGYEPTGNFKLNGQSIQPEGMVKKFLEISVACNDSRLREESGRWVIDGSPTEGALLTLGEKAGISRERIEEDWKRIDSIPFESERKFMATLNEGRNGREIFLKGSPEEIFTRSRYEIRNGDRSPVDAQEWKRLSESLADDGHRVLAVAFRETSSDGDRIEISDVESDFTILGLVGLQDPPREEVIQAVEECTQAGIHVKMITGDHALTARSIGAQIGVGDGRTVMTDSEIEDATDAMLLDQVEQVDVYARVSPEHKLRLVSALQDRGHITAMTGDGVNDAPALKKADIGIAMGKKGTQAAKEASEMVLADDNFASIVHAVEEGRIVYDNIKKALIFILPTNGGESLLVITALLLGLVLPITPAQILWVNMVTAVTLALALAFEPREKDIMRRPPRGKDEPLVPLGLFIRILLVSILLMMASLCLFTMCTAQGYPAEHARTVAVNMLIIGEIFYLFNSRFMTTSSLSLSGIKATRYAWAATIIVILLQIPFTYLPVFHDLFGTRAIGLQEWLVICALGFALFLVVEAEKAIKRSLTTGSGRSG